MSAPPPPVGDEGRRRIRRLTALVTVAVVAILTVLVWWLARTAEQSRYERREADEVAGLRTRLAGSTDLTAQALVGSESVIRDDGSVDDDAFRVLGQAVADTTEATIVAREVLVSRAERGSFERTWGLPIQSIGPDGRLQPSPVRDRYCPVVTVIADDPALQGVRGFDICGEQVRGEAVRAAIASGGPVLSAPFASAQGQEPSVFLVKPLSRPGAAGGRPVGLMTAGFTLATLIDPAVDGLPPGVRYRIADGEVTVAQSPDPPRGGATERFEVYGRSWVVETDAAEPSSHTGSWLLLAGGLAFALLVALLLARTLRYERETERLSVRRGEDARRNAALARFAQELANVRSRDQAARHVAVAAPGVLGATVGVLELTEPDGSVRRVAHGPGPVSEERRAPDETLADAARAHGAVEVTEIVIRDRSGADVGRLGLGWATVRPEATDEPTLSTMANVVGQTLERAALAETLTRDAMVSRQLADLSGALSRSRTLEDVASTAVSQLVGEVGARWGVFALIDGDSLVTTAGDLGPREWGRAIAAAEDAARMASGGAVLWDGEVRRAELDRRAWILPGNGPVAVVPLELGEPARAAVLLGFAAGHEVGPTHISFLASAASRVRQALERAELSEAERRIAAALQHSLLTVDVTCEAVAYAARYLSAEAPLEVGGDWYDVIDLAPARVGVAVGDAVGRGLSAATVMGQLRSALNAVAGEAADTRAAIQVLDGFAGRTPGALCSSVAFAVVDAERSTLELSLAGHPPPLVLDPHGQGGFVEGGRGWPLLGRSTEERPAPSVVDFPAGSLALFYTDGLVERRGEVIDVGLARLHAAAAEAWQLPLAALCQHLIRRLSAAQGQGDDVVVVALRTVGCSAELFVRVVPADLAELAPLRADLRTWLQEQQRLGPDRVDDLLLATGEAAANAIEHGVHQDARRRIRVEAGRLADRIMISVSDPGQWAALAVSRHPDRGHGLGLIRSLTDHLTIDRTDMGTCVTMTFTA